MPIVNTRKEKKIQGYDVVIEYKFRSSEEIEDRGDFIDIKISKFGNTFYDEGFFTKSDENDVKKIPLYIRKVIKGRLDIGTNCYFVRCSRCFGEDKDQNENIDLWKCWKPDYQLGALVKYYGDMKFIMKNNCVEGYYYKKNKVGIEEIGEMFLKNSYEFEAQELMRFVEDMLN